MRQMRKQGKAGQQEGTARKTAGRCCGPEAIKKLMAGCCEGSKCECGPGMKRFFERLCGGTGKRCC